MKRAENKYQLNCVPQIYIYIFFNIFLCLYLLESCTAALGMQNEAITDARITASSMWGENHSPARARLNLIVERMKRGAWSARQNNLNQWIQVDLGEVTKVTHIATQGRQDASQWVKSYSLQYGNPWKHFKDGKIFTGNFDRNTIVGHDIEPVIATRYIKVLPKTWYKHISMRMELYGCTDGIEGNYIQTAVEN